MSDFVKPALAGRTKARTGMEMAPALELTASPVATLHHLYRAHGATLRQALARLAPTLDADDLLHETFVVALEHVGKLASARQPRAWLFGIGLKLAATRRRTSRLRRFFGLEVVSELPGVDSASRSVEQRDAQRRVEAALASLSQAHREVFVLFELQGLSGEEIAEACGVPLKTVWTRLFHARKQLGAALERQLATEARISGLDRSEVTP